MIFVHLLVTVVAGIAAAVATLMGGHSVILAVLAYAGGGALGLLASAGVALALPAGREPAAVRGPRPQPAPVARHG